MLPSLVPALALIFVKITKILYDGFICISNLIFLLVPSVCSFAAFGCRKFGNDSLVALPQKATSDDFLQARYWHSLQMQDARMQTQVFNAMDIESSLSPKNIT